MANNKIGFDYFNLDTDRYQDKKIKRLKKDFSCSGIAIYDYILNEIYRVKGCFIVWDEDTAFDVAEYFGIKESLVNEVVNYCCVVGLFDRELLARERILSSLAIQKRYLEMCNRAKRSFFSIPENVIIQEVSKIITEESKIINKESGYYSGDLPQSKVEESKVEESKVKKLSIDFETFRKAYPGSKRGLETEFTNFKKKHKDWKECLDKLLPGIEKEIEYHKLAKSLNVFVAEYANMNTWINQRRWETELPEIEIQKGGKNGRDQQISESLERKRQFAQTIAELAEQQK